MPTFSSDCGAGEFYSLGACRHVYCHDCIKGLLRVAISDNKFPVRCIPLGDDIVCNQPVCVSDLVEMLPAEQLLSMYEAVKRTYINTHGDTWGTCPTPDCPQVGLALQEP
jgi:hypothetical protein